MSADISSYLSTTTTLSSAEKILYQEEILDKAKSRLIFDRYAYTKPIGRGDGGTYRIQKLLRQPVQTTADTEGYLYGYADAKKFTSESIDLTPENWGDSFVFSRKVPITVFLGDEEYQAEIANQMARTLDRRVAEIIATRSLRWRIDKDATYMKSGTVGATVTSASSFYSNLTDGNDTYNGGVLAFTNPESAAYDEARKITDFVQSDGVFTTTAFQNAPTASASKFLATAGTGIASSDKLTTDGLLDVRALHSELETEPFDGNTLQMFIHTANERDLWDDTTWENTAIYDDSGRFANYQLVRWCGLNMHISSNIYREDANGTENLDDGDVYCLPVIGRKAYALMRWGQGMGDFGVDWEYKDSADTSDLRNKFRAISWDSHFACDVTRATSVVTLLCGATGIGVSILNSN